MSPSTQRLAIGLAAAAGLPVLSALFADAFDTYLHVHSPSMIFLCSVILAAIWLGRSVGLATAFVAFFVYNFYLAEPRNTLNFAGFEDVLTLLVFVGVALLIGGMAGTLHDERERAKEQAQIFASLFAISRFMADSRQPDEAMKLMASGVCQLAADQAVIFLGGEDGAPVARYSAPAGAVAPSSVQGAAAALLKPAPAAPAAEGEEVEGWRLDRIQTGEDRVAVLAWKPLAGKRSEERMIAVRLLSELAHIAIQRVQIIRRQLEVDTLAATDRLRTALMSSISHDFRTPLSTILTSASTLQAYGDQFSPATRADLLTSIQEEAERLNRFIRNILDMTRLDAGVVRPREEWIDPLEILENIEERMRARLAGRRLTVTSPAAVPSISADAMLLEQALANVVENALVHTPAGSTIRVGADYTENMVRLWVEDDGPGVPSSELAHIFDKFHRLENTQNTQGAGLGLAISKGFVEAMRGEVKAISPAQAEMGLRVEFSFPLQTELANA